MPSLVWLVTLTTTVAMVACVNTPARTTKPAVQADPQTDPQTDPQAVEEPEHMPESQPPPAPEPYPDPDPKADAQTKQALRASIQTYLRDLQACYEAALVDDATLAGKMTYTITIQPSGEVSGVIIESDTVGSEAVAACARVEIQSWVFDRQRGTEASEVTFSAKFVAI